MLQPMDWSSLGPALLALTGVALGWVVSARQRSADREAQRAQWQRNHLYDLYVRIVPVLRSIESAADSAWSSVNDPATRLGGDRAQLRDLLMHAEIICSRDTLAAIRPIYRQLLDAGWQERLRTEGGAGPEDAPARKLGSRPAMRRQVELVITSMRTDLGVTDTPSTVQPRGIAWFPGRHRPETREDAGRNDS